MNDNRILLLAGVTGLSIPFFILLLSTAGFIAGLPLSVFHLPMAFCCSGIFAFWVSGIIFPGSRKKFFLPVILFWIIFAAGVFIICRLLYDYTYDGQAYHQDIMAALADGWNPVYASHSPGDSPSSLWVNHYNKGVETIQAAINVSFGNIEAGKGISFILVLSSFCLFRYMLDVRFRTIGRWKKLFYSVAFTLCPVVVCQWLTYYIDWTLYSLLLSLVSVFCLIKGRKEHIVLYAVTGMVIFMAACFKFNILFYIGLAVIFYGMFLVWNRQYKILKHLVSTAVLSLGAGVLIGAYNPYITNTFEHGNPFYPLTGENKVDIMTDNTPAKLVGKGRLESIIRAYFSYPTNDRKYPVEWAMPATVRRPQEIYNIMVDQRVGGFGAFFSAILLFGILPFIFAMDKKNRRKKRYYVLILLALVASLFVLPSGWWARYVPFFWTVPLVMLLYTEEAGLKSPLLRFFRGTAWFFISVTVIILTAASCKTSLDYSKQIRRSCLQLQAFRQPLRVSFGIFPEYSKKLERYGIPYTVIPAGTDITGMKKTFLLQENDLVNGVFIVTEEEEPVGKQPSE